MAKRHLYTVSGFMETDTPLTQEEIDWLSMRLGMHIDDPEGVEDDRHARWTRFDWGVRVTPAGTRNLSEFWIVEGAEGGLVHAVPVADVLGSLGAPLCGQYLIGPTIVSHCQPAEPYSAEGVREIVLDDTELTLCSECDRLL